ncbi:acyltransferase [Actinomadura sp. NPDC047616]|uniref:acyltransferase family protein n=1 Tax=Actinomadura sp. NPDC047616 TaxID=3155914 RepID=UPI0033E25246
MAPPAVLSRPDETAVAVRLGWLDALRGWAALVVALHHASFYYVPELRAQMVGWFDPGRYGVLLFFLVSGYIVPVSLERHGDVRRFWIGRFFRIYPLLAVACAVPVALAVLGLREMRAGLGDYDPVVAVLAHVTMLQDVLAVPNAINVLWTLSYEMAFYLVVVALFVVKGGRRPGAVAGVCVVAALVAGGVLPVALFSRTAGIGVVVLGTAVLLAAAVGLAMYGQGAVRIAGGVAGGVVAVLLVALNSRIGAWEGLVILAVMFTGTVVYRAEHGQMGRRAAAGTMLAVLAGVVAAGVGYAQVSVPEEQVAGFRVYWTGSVLLAAGSFAGAWLLRERRFPRWWTGLGTISFSVYLVHHVLLMLSDRFLGTSGRDEVHRLVVFVVVLLAVSRVTYRWIEAPAQRFGRALGARGLKPPA